MGLISLLMVKSRIVLVIGDEVREVVRSCIFHLFILESQEVLQIQIMDMHLQGQIITDYFDLSLMVAMACKVV